MRCIIMVVTSTSLPRLILTAPFVLTEVPTSSSGDALWSPPSDGGAKGMTAIM